MSTDASCPRPRGRHRAPGPTDRHPAGLWGITPAWYLDVQPGHPPVPLTRMPVPAPDPTASDAGVFDGLTPPLAALLVMTYTGPGDVILDATRDLAVEGPARAGGRDYHQLDPYSPVAPGPTCQASLILVKWPAGESAAEDLPDIGEALAACRDLLRPDGHLFVVARRVPVAELRDVAKQVAVVTRASGLGRLLHVIEIIREDQEAEGAEPAPAAGRSPGLLAIVSRAAGGRHA